MHLAVKQRLAGAMRQMCAATGAAIVAVSVAGAQANPALPAYPNTPRGNQTDDLSGSRVADPYRWLESVAALDVHAWVTSQNALAESFLAQLSRRKEIQTLVSWTWAYSKVSAPFGGGDRLFFYENSGLENQAALRVQDRKETPSRVLIDPDAFSRDGLIAIVDQSASPDGRYLAYATSVQGSAWRVVRIRDVRTSQDLSEELRGIKDGPLAWTKDERGFFYTRSDAGRQSSTANPLAPDGRQQVFYHHVGRPQSDDDLVFENARRPDWRLRADVSEDGQYVIISARAGVDEANRLMFIDLDNPKKPNLGAPMVKLFDAGDAMYEFVSNTGPVFFIRTTKNAPRARLVAVDINSPDENHWTTVVRETYDALVECRRVDDRLVAHRLRDAHSVLELYAMDGGPRGTIYLPGVGTVTAITPRTEFRELYFEYSSFLQPPTVYRYDLESRMVSAFRDAHADTSYARYETTQLYYASKDGTRIPMWVTARRGITLDGTHPTLLSGAGSFNLAGTPAWTAEVAAWLQLGGIYAVANVRGGGENGRAWHDAAAGARKGVAIDDMTAAAEFLITQHYTNAAQLGVTGKGASGLLAAGTMVAHPELFGAAAIDAGLLDMLRYTKFTIGSTWTSEFGSPDKPSDLRALLAYSPLQNIRAGTRYPATLVTVGDHDEVATPAHSYKFAAALQAAQAAPAPVLLRVDLETGFGPGTPIAHRLALDTDQLTFLAGMLRLR